MAHWKKYMNPNYIGSYAFEPDEEKVLTIDHTGVEEIADQNGEMKEKLVIHFKEPEKPLILNKTNAAAIEKALETPDVDLWKDAGIILCVQTVSTPRGMTDAVRVRPVKPFVCEECGAFITGHNGMSHTEWKYHTKGTYGKVLCPACAEKAEKKKK